jgi:hypothetical protein
MADMQDNEDAFYEGWQRQSVYIGVEAETLRMMF